jgi:hypothetical protein
MDAVTQSELEKYGSCAEYRIPLALIGKNVPAGILDKRSFQQSDLIRMIPKLSLPESRLSPYPILVGRYVKPFIGDAPAPTSVAYETNEKKIHCTSGTTFGSIQEGFDGAPEEALNELRRATARLQFCADHNC